MNKTAAFENKFLFSANASGRRFAQRLWIRFEAHRQKKNSPWTPLSTADIY